MTVAPTPTPPIVWDRVVCAVDLSPASIGAATIAARLMPATASLVLCTVLSPATTEGATPVDGTLTLGSRPALDRAQAQIGAFHDAELPSARGTADPANPG